jgi:hypothetical protein
MSLILKSITFQDRGTINTHTRTTPAALVLRSSLCSDKFHKGVMVGRWVLLGLIGVQVFGVGVALLLRYCVGVADRYDEFQEDDYQARRKTAEAQLEKLRSKITGVGSAATDKKKSIALTATSSSSATPSSTARLYSMYGPSERDVEGGTISAG